MLNSQGTSRERVQGGSGSYWPCQT